MKIFARVNSLGEVIRTDSDDFKDPGWYELEREPNHWKGEYLEQVGETIVIKKREKTPEEVEAEEKAKKNAASFTPAAFADLVKRVEALEKKG